MRTWPALLLTAVLSSGARFPACERCGHTLESVRYTKAPTGVTHTFEISAHQYGYTITPFPFSVAVGDTVVIHATSSDVVHGLAMNTYVTDAMTLVPGETETRTFVADKVGQFTFGCTSFCGEFHFVMVDSFHVYSPDSSAPTISTLAPMSGSVNGATIAINGSNFSRDTKVRVGEISVPNAFVSSALIYTLAPPHAPGVVPVTVMNADGQFAAANFIYEAPPAPPRRRAVKP